MNARLPLVLASRNRKKSREVAEILAERHLTVSVRKSRGRDIRAACGQLITEGPKKSAAQQLAAVTFAS